MEWLSALGKDLAEFGKIIRDDTVEAAAKASNGKLGKGGSVHPVAAEAQEDAERRGEPAAVPWALWLGVRHCARHCDACAARTPLSAAATRKALERAQEEVEKDLEDLGWGDDEDVLATGSEEDADAEFAAAAPGDAGPREQAGSDAASGDGTPPPASTGTCTNGKRAAGPSSGPASGGELAHGAGAPRPAEAAAPQDAAGGRPDAAPADDAGEAEVGGTGEAEGASGP